MKKLNVEIKARCHDPAGVREALRQRHAEFKGRDRQTDTYFKVPSGRLKLREGNIENYLIHYDREESQGLRESRVLLFRTEPGSFLKEVLARALGVLAVVEKEREIYFVRNIKFHIDRLAGFGTFVEIEAIDEEGLLGREELSRQCREAMEWLSLGPEDGIAGSYSDMILRTPAQGGLSS